MTMVPRWMMSGRETIVEGVLGTSDASLFYRQIGICFIPVTL